MGWGYVYYLLLAATSFPPTYFSSCDGRAHYHGLHGVTADAFEGACHYLQGAGKAVQSGYSGCTLSHLTSEGGVEGGLRPIRSQEHDQTGTFAASLLTIVIAIATSIIYRVPIEEGGRKGRRGEKKMKKKRKRSANSLIRKMFRK